MSGSIVEFLRKKDFELIEELGQGACGRTVLLHDPIIDEYFVCKKYSPISEALRDTLFDNFVREIKLLHRLNHINIVRVFNYYLYPEQRAGYIVMEYVRGSDIEDHLAAHPEDINEIFIQVIEGFAHLEKNKILHRDIRTQNVLVTESSIIKIIDFGFGKAATSDGDFDKSISLNWWCEVPFEFGKSIYDYRTEVYFVGKLFEKIVIEQGLEHFKHTDLLKRMCAFDPVERIASFADARRELLSDKFLNIDFSYTEQQNYRRFSSSLHAVISKIEQNTKYFDEIDDIQSRLEELYKRVMLEEFIPDNTSIIKCFVKGSYYFHRALTFRVDVLKDFIDLFRSCSREKKNIILSNIQTKLDSVNRYDVRQEVNDIPF